MRMSNQTRAIVITLVKNIGHRFLEKADPIHPGWNATVQYLVEQPLDCILQEKIIRLKQIALAIWAGVVS